MSKQTGVGFDFATGGAVAASALSEGLKFGAGYVNDQNAKAEADKRAAEYRTAHADETQAAKVAEVASKKAYDAGVAARQAKARADATEKNANGPAHQAAKKLADQAALLDVDKKAAEAELNYYRPSVPPPVPPFAAAHEAVPRWLIVGGGVLGALLVGGTLVALIRGRR